MKRNIGKYSSWIIFVQKSNHINIEHRNRIKHNESGMIIKKEPLYFIKHRNSLKNILT